MHASAMETRLPDAVLKRTDFSSDVDVSSMQHRHDLRSLLMMLSRRVASGESSRMRGNDSPSELGGDFGGASLGA
jgi:hypothetical protein